MLTLVAHTQPSSSAGAFQFPESYPHLRLFPCVLVPLSKDESREEISMLFEK